jgi:hypothetical protein
MPYPEDRLALARLPGNARTADVAASRSARAPTHGERYVNPIL